MSTAAGSAWATRSRAPEPVCAYRVSPSWPAATPGSAWCRCAPAAEWASRSSSSASDQAGGASMTDRAASAQARSTARGRLTPLDGGSPPFIFAASFDLALVGYIEAEYVLAGSARAYARTRRGVTAAEQADYVTRVIIYRPAADAAFNGPVWVEWLNVSGGIDVAAAWMSAHTELIRRGAAWVGVSAQQIGVSGGTSVLGLPGPGLVGIDPARYGTLHHPGDRFSYDIYAQASAAARIAAGTILAGLPIERVLAIGESQSAFR